MKQHKKEPNNISHIFLTSVIITVHRQAFSAFFAETTTRYARFAYEITITLMFAETKTTSSFDVAETEKILVSANSNLGFHENN